MKIDRLSLKKLMNVQVPNITPNNPQIISPLIKSDQLFINTENQRPKTIEQVKIKAMDILNTNTWTVTIKDDPTPRQIIVAGRTNFNAFWTRDAMYASMGDLAVGKTEPVRDSLKTLLDYQFQDGLLSRRMGHNSATMNLIMKTLGLNKDKYSHFDTVDDQGTGYWWTGTGAIICPDGNLLMTIVAEEYVSKTGDQEFLREYYGKISKAIGWVSSHLDKDGLVEQTPFSDWKDVVNRGKTTMYNQALYFQALNSMAVLADKLGKKPEADAYRIQAVNLGQKIQEKFWDQQKGYFRDSEIFSHFSPDGNLFAVTYGLTTPNQTSRIFAHCDALLNKNEVLPATEGQYPKRNVSLMHRLAGMGDYHDNVRWTWQNALYAIAAVRTGDRERAEKVLGNYAGIIQRDENIYEVYEGNKPGPINRLFYKSEKGFSWSAGLFLKAQAELYPKL